MTNCAAPSPEDGAAFSAAALADITAPLLTWFHAKKRTLPWRDDPQPYYVWVSEIMLQQTRVTAVLPYFTRFINALPDVAALAAVSDDTLLKLWEGLGYYHRAHNLKKAAAIVLRDYEGKLPTDFARLLKLPGIGRYTAGAISSIAGGHACPAVDGNVLRVVMRLTGSRLDIMKERTRRIVEAALTDILPQEVGAFNQALMELGALICLPRSAAHCGECPLSSLCTAHATGCVAELPCKEAKKERRIERRTVLWIERGGTIAIAQRPKRGLLAELWELPNFPGHLTRAAVMKLAQGAGWSVSSLKSLPAARHIFTHIEWQLTGWRLALTAGCIAEPRAPYGEALLPPLVWAAPEELKQRYSVPAAFQHYFPADLAARP